MYSKKQAKRLSQFNDLAEKVASFFWPGPVTIILKKYHLIPDLVTSGLDSVAIRCPNNKIFLSLLKKTQFPLAAPSANPFGYISPTSAQHVKSTLGTKINYILDGGDTKIGIESTVIDIRNEIRPIILRYGPISKKILEEKLKCKFYTTISKKIISPGLLKYHYKPKTPLHLVSIQELINLLNKNNNSKNAYVFIKYPDLKFKKNTYWLSKNGDPIEVARNLYRKLIDIDNEKFNKIYVQKPLKKEIGTAIFDRLFKASEK